jgi:hypothetical protein
MELTGYFNPLFGCSSKLPLSMCPRTTLKPGVLAVVPVLSSYYHPFQGFGFSPSPLCPFHLQFLLTFCTGASKSAKSPSPRTTPPALDGKVTSHVPLITPLTAHHGYLRDFRFQMLRTEQRVLPRRMRWP